MPGKREPLVGPGTFERVQEVFASRSAGQAPRSAPEPYPLAGKLRCTKCGGPMFGSTTLRGDKVYRYYKCATALKKGSAACPGTLVRAEDVET